SIGLTGVVALKGCFPLAEADSHRANSAVVVGVGVVEEAESPFFFLALAFSLVVSSIGSITPYCCVARCLDTTLTVENSASSRT
nr:hypothetical protein [Tanacetum cinerariifolium]